MKKDQLWYREKGPMKMTAPVHMKTCFFIAAFLFLALPVFAQPEISSGIVVNKQNGIGFPIHVAYGYYFSKKFSTKSQIGFKYMHRDNDFVNATLNIHTWEFHQTLGFDLVNKKNYVLVPNAGFNFRFYVWKGKMEPPYNSQPQRAWVIGTRDGNFVLNTHDSQQRALYISNLGFSFQLQNQFRLNNKTWLHITPFLEPDYDGSQVIGGAYVGVIFKPVQ